MRKTLMTLATTAALLAAGVASAADNTSNVQLELTVDTSCYLFADEQATASLGGFTGLGGGAFEIEDNTSATVLMDFACNAGLPFTLETNAGPGGMIYLEGDTSGTSVSARVVGMGDVPFGSVANGEELALVGTGEVVQRTFDVWFNQDAAGLPLALPAVDTYRTTLVITQTF